MRLPRLRPWRPPVRRALPVSNHCPGSGEWVSTRTQVMNGLAGCPARGHLVRVVHHEDGGPGGVLAAHDLEGNEL